ncbi:glycoside hydrolase family 29 (alpha-L-fucosidase) [bacterium]|nr:MAG: glycoside hydrolase family 29 (alpha-L-fucosidase) [bacterium]
MTTLSAPIVKPEPRQLEWQRMEANAFVHFGPNTFTSEEWGSGREDPNVFAPTQLDCDQWVRTFKDAGLKGVVVTAKHHDGFCLWPTKFSTHTVAQSRWRNGQGDVLKELSAACRRHGLKFGVYLSPWDRNHPAYGTPEYNEVFKSMLREVLTEYGPVFEVWFDGANGEGPNGKRQVYDWPAFIQTVRECQPKAVIFSDAGPDARWVGNEDGHSAPTCWSTIDRDRYVPGTPLSAELIEGKQGGTHWVPAECDVSIRPGWFYRESEDEKVKSPATLLDLWERSVGQNAVLLLNVPPNREGKIAAPDVASLKEWNRLRKSIYGRNLAKGAKVNAPRFMSGNEGEAIVDSKPETYWSTRSYLGPATVELELPTLATFDRVGLGEAVENGQQVNSFAVDAYVDDVWKEIGNGTTIGYRRILHVPKTTAQKVRIRFLGAIGMYTMSSFTLHLSE